MKRKEVKELKTQKRKAEEFDEEELEDLATDVRLMKKLKQGKVRILSQKDIHPG
jgi:predicted DNA-binding protein